MDRLLGTLSALLALTLPPPQDAESLWREGRRVEALEAMERALSERPQDQALRRLLAERAMGVQRFASALEHARALGPGGAALKGRALYFLARYEEALPHLSAEDPALVLLRAEALHKLGRFDEESQAIDAAARALGAEHGGVLLLRARRAEHRGEHALAAELHGLALEREPLEGAALFGLGRALVRLGRVEEGRAVLERHRALVPLLDQLEHAERGLALAPLHAPNHAALGDAWRALVPHSSTALGPARRAYERAGELAAEAERAPIALRHARLLHEEAADLEGALAVLVDAERRTLDPRLPVRRGDLLAAAGRRDEARAAYGRALELAPGEAAVLERLRALAAERGR